MRSIADSNDFGSFRCSATLTEQESVPPARRTRQHQLRPRGPRSEAPICRPVPLHRHANRVSLRQREVVAHTDLLAIPEHGRTRQRGCRLSGQFETPTMTSSSIGASRRRMPRSYSCMRGSGTERREHVFAFVGGQSTRGRSHRGCEETSPTGRTPGWAPSCAGTPPMGWRRARQRPNRFVRGRSRRASVDGRRCLRKCSCSRLMGHIGLGEDHHVSASPRCVQGVRYGETRRPTADPPGPVPSVRSRTGMHPSGTPRHRAVAEG